MDFQQGFEWQKSVEGSCGLWAGCWKCSVPETSILGATNDRLMLLYNIGSGSFYIDQKRMLCLRVSQAAETQDAESAFGSDSSSVLEWKPSESLPLKPSLPKPSLAPPTTRKPLSALNVQVRDRKTCPKLFLVYSIMGPQRWYFQAVKTVTNAIFHHVKNWK